MITVENIGSEIFVFGRRGRVSFVEKISDFKPYFYAIEEKGMYKTIDGKNCLKFVVNSPDDVPKMREKYEHCEADIPYVNRYIIDTWFDKTIEKAEPKLCYLDIEVEVHDGFPNADKAKERILSIATFDTYLNKYVVFVLHPNGEHIDQKFDDKSYYMFPNEELMLNKFIEFIKKTDPDILIAWNGDNFDFAYLINRLNKLGLGANKLSRLNKSYMRDKTPKILGRVCFDLLYGYKKISQGERESYSLDYCAKYELGIGKEKYEGALNDLWKNHHYKFIDYNIKDVELLKLLNEKLKIFEFFDEVRRYAKCQITDVFMNSKIVDCLLLSHCKNKVVLPSKTKHKDEPIEGATVFEPKAGLHENVVCLDCKSLYPSLLCQFNMSPETVGSEGVKIGNGICFNQDTIGILVEIVKNLFFEREKYKKLMKEQQYGSPEYKAYDQLQYAVKVILNSIYGVVGYGGFRLFKREMAESITYMGRQVIQWAKTTVEKEGYEVILGDTDSIFVTIKEGNAIEKGKELAQRITTSFEEFLKPYNLKNEFLLMQLDKVFETFLSCGMKKRYAGKQIYPGKEIKIVGFQNRRSDMPAFGREFQKQVFDMILNKKSKEEVLAFIEQNKQELRKQPVENIGLPIGISKKVEQYKNVPIHIRAVQNANNHQNAKFTDGDKIKYIYLKDQIGVIAFNDKWWGTYHIDYDKMTERIITNPVQPIIDVLGWEGRAKSLFDFT